MIADSEQDAARAVLAVAAADHPYPAERFGGRGIVVCAGGARLFTCAWVGLSVLRRTLGCRLPIEVWHLGEAELGPVEAALLAELDVTTVDALALRARHPARTLGGWELKSYALANCRFEEVLLLDADNVAVRDPTFLCDADEYRAAGAAFWPDVQRLAPDSAIWELCGVPYRNEPAWESGQIVLDKARCWAALQVARHMNDHSEVFYRHLHGDKDTFHMAWRMLDQPYAMTTARPRVMDYGLLQHDFAGEPLFAHRTTAKWALRAANPVSARFHHGEACLAALAELGDRWSGRIDVVPDRSAGDHDAEAELAAVRLFRMQRVASDAIVLELLPGNRVGEGRRGEWLRWHVQDDVLTLAGRSGVSARLQRDAGDTWRGASLAPGGDALELCPLAPAGDPVGAVVAALVERVAEGALASDDAVAALVALTAIADVAVLLAAERARRPDGSTAAAMIDEARWRVGRRNPSLRANDGGAARRYLPR